MPQRTAVHVEVPGLRIDYEGGEALYREVLREIVSPIAGGAWRTVGAPLVVDPPCIVAEERPSAPAAREAPAAPAPLPSAPAPTRAAAGFDPERLLSRLAAEGGRRSEKDAVLLALVALGGAGRRDATPAEIVAHLESRGYAARELKPRPILAKLSHRKGLVAPGVLPNTFRATPAGSAYIWKRAATA
jgi:hypothetical protein